MRGRLNPHTRRLDKDIGRDLEGVRDALLRNRIERCSLAGGVSKLGGIQRGNEIVNSKWKTNRHCFFHPIWKIGLCIMPKPGCYPIQEGTRNSGIENDHRFLRKGPNSLRKEIALEVPKFTLLPLLIDLKPVNVVRIVGCVE